MPDPDPFAAIARPIVPPKANADPYANIAKPIDPYASIAKPINFDDLGGRRVSGPSTGSRPIIVPREDIPPGMVVVYCLGCGHALFADGGWKRSHKVRCRCSLVNVFSDSSEPLIGESYYSRADAPAPNYSSTESRTSDLATRPQSQNELPALSVGGNGHTQNNLRTGTVGRSSTILRIPSSLILLGRVVRSRFQDLLGAAILRRAK